MITTQYSLSLSPLHLDAIQLLPDVLLQHAVLVADVVSHDSLPVRQVLTLTLSNGTVERLRHWQLPSQPLLEVDSSCKIFSN